MRPCVHAPARNHFERAFTMIEMLVVSTIITAIVALLLPALQSAKENAKRIKCMNNLHHIGVGVQLYLTDHGHYPYVAYYDNFTSYYSWAEQILPNMIRGNFVRSAVPSDPSLTRWQYGGQWTTTYFSCWRWPIYECPSAPKPANRPYGFSYAANSVVFGGPPISNAASCNEARLGDIMLVCDTGVSVAPWQDNTAFYSLFGVGYDVQNDFEFSGYAVATTRGNFAFSTWPTRDTDSGWSGSEGYPVYMRHKGRCYAVFADGHVAGFRNGELKRRNLVASARGMTGGGPIDMYYP